MIKKRAVSSIAEKSVWTGVQTGLALLSVEALTPLSPTTSQLLLTAGIAAALSAIKNFSQERLTQLALDDVEPED